MSPASEAQKLNLMRWQCAAWSVLPHIEGAVKREHGNVLDSWTDRENWTALEKEISFSAVHSPQIPHKMMQHSTAAIQSANSTKLPNSRIQQYWFETCTAKLFVACIDTALCTDTGTNTKYWKVQLLTDSGYQDLQHYLLITNRFLKRTSDPICSTATARTC